MTGGVPDSGGGLGRAAFLNGGQGTGRRIYPLWTKADSPNAGGKRAGLSSSTGKLPKRFLSFKSWTPMPRSYTECMETIQTNPKTLIHSFITEIQGEHYF